MNVVALEQAINTLIGRHEILRTVFREDEQGEVRQFILPTLNFSIDYVDLSNGEDEDSCIKKDYSRPFDLGEGPLLRASV